MADAAVQRTDANAAEAERGQSDGFPLFFFFFNDTATTEIYTFTDTLSLHDALPISNLT
jgi:hypothetical protein